MSMKKYIVTLNPKTLNKEEREYLNKIASGDSHKSQKIINALLPLGCDEGVTRQALNDVCKDAIKMINDTMESIGDLIIWSPNVQ